MATTDILSDYEMNEIPQIEDKVEALRLYLEANKNDNEGDSWIFGHYPIMIEHLNTFDKKDYDKLIIEMPIWKDDIVSYDKIFAFPPPPGDDQFTFSPIQRPRMVCRRAGLGRVGNFQPFTGNLCRVCQAFSI